MRKLSAWKALASRFPLQGDVLAGAMVAVLVIPQSLAYALLAGLPAPAGLVASVLPVLAYAWLGSSRTQAVGPVAITAIMTSSLLAPLAAPGSAQHVVLAALLALLSGAWMLAFGLLRLGFLAQLLSRPVISGFISGSALLIVIHQAHHLLGLPGAQPSVLQAVLALGRELHQAHPPTLLLSALSVMALVLSRTRLAAWLQRFGVAAPVAERGVRLAPLCILLLATGWVVLTDADRAGGVAVVGSVRLDAALWTWVWPDAAQLQQLLAPALTLAFVGTVQGITMAQALAVQRHERLDANRELVGLGAANVVAAFSGGMPIGGGMSRTALNTAAGARSQWASVVTALTIAALMGLGTQWLQRMPVAVLAASIVVAALGMVDLRALRQAWAYDRADAAAMVATAVGVWVLGLELGIVLGIALSLATLLYRASTPHIAVIGRIPGTEHFRNVARHGVVTIPGVLLMRIDESLYFGNLQAVETRLGVELSKDPGIRELVLIMSAVNRVDTTAMEALADLNRDLWARGIRLHLAEVKGPVQDRLERVALWRELSGEVFLSVNAAFEALQHPSSTKRYQYRSAQGSHYEGWEVI